MIYFDAIDVSAEALINAMNRSRSISDNIGLTVSRYEDTVNTLYFIFYAYAKFAIENHKVELLRLCIYRMIRGIGFMAGKNVDGCKLDLSDFLVSLGIRIACDPELKDKSVYGSNRIIDEIVEVINRYADHEALSERKSSIEHDLFNIVYSQDAQDFESRLIGW